MNSLRITVILYAVMLIVGLSLVLAVLYLIHGSSEMYPTQQQHAGVRIVLLIIVACLLVVEVLLWSFIRYLKRRS